MAGSLIDITVQGDEVLVALKGLPKKIQDALTNKLYNIVTTIHEDLFHTLPAKYLDPGTIHSGVTQQGTTLIGYIESQDKTGFYPIVPVKARMLRFVAKSGDLVRTRYVRHPYLKGSDILAQRMAQLKPWIEDQLYDALIETL
jgi:hypothetical protein